MEKEGLQERAEKLNKAVDEAKLITEITDKLAQSNRYASDRQNYINLAYFAGKQWISYDKMKRRVYEPPKDPNKTYYVGNRIQPIVRTELSKIIKNKPVMEVIPASSDETDVDAAKVGGKIIDWLEYSLNMQEIDEELVMWALTTDIVFLEPFWNPGKGDTIQDPDTGEILKTGDVDIDVVNAFEIKWDKAAKKWKDVRWICKERPRDVDYIKEMYNKEVSPESDVAGDNMFECQLQNLNNTFNSSGLSPMKNMTIVKEYWERPSSKYPKGRRITFANGVLLFYSEDIGFSDKDPEERELPFFPMWHIDVPGRVGGQSIIENLIPIQREYNKSRSQIIDNKNLMANPKWVVENGALVDDPTDDAGQVLEYYKGFNAPHRDQPASMGADVYKNLEQIENEFYAISRQNEAGGTARSSDKNNLSGVALSILEEQDYTTIAPTVNKYIRCKQQTMSYMLRMVKYKYEIPRTLKIIGKNKEVELLEFEGSQLTSTDVRVQEGTALQQSKASKQQWVMNLIASKVLDPTNDRDVILKMLELGIVDDLYDSTDIDHDQAQGEQLKWSKGDMSPGVKDFFNHQIHVFEHNKFRKISDYEKMPPDQQAAIDAHVAQHMQFLQPQGQQQPQPQELDPKAFLDNLPEEQRQAILNSPNPEQALMDAMKGGAAGGQMPQM